MKLLSVYCLLIGKNRLDCLLKHSSRGLQGLRSSFLGCESFL